MAGLKIARGLELDPDYVGGGTFAALAKKGWGKTYFARVLAEELARTRVPFVCLDPMDAFWGLRLSKDGKPAGGLDVPIFGGKHGDVPLEPTAGKLMADLVVDEGLSMILSLKHFGTRAAEKRFAEDFLDRLYRRNEDLVHLLMDEADLFAPQRPQHGDQKLLGITENIVRRGRNNGIGITMFTQRPASLNKEVLTQVDGLMVGRMLGPQDRNAIDSWVGEHGDVAASKRIKDELPEMQTGEGWLWIPEEDILKKVRIRKARTFDSSPTRKRSSRTEKRMTLADVDLDAISDKISSTVERAKAEDPKELRKQISQLRKEVADLEARKPEPAEPPEPIVKVVIDGKVAKEVTAAATKIDEAARPLREVVAEAEHIAGNIRRQVDDAIKAMNGNPPLVPGTRNHPARVETPNPPRRRRREQGPPSDHAAAPAEVDPEVKLKAGARRMLDSLAMLHPHRLTRSQLALLSDLRPKSGTFSEYLSACKRAGFVEEASGTIGLTAPGEREMADSLGAGAPAPRELAEMWAKKLKAGARRMLDALLDVHPEEMTREELALASEVVAKSGTFSEYLSMLKRNGLAEETDGFVCAGEALFLGTRT